MTAVGVLFDLFIFAICIAAVFLLHPSLNPTYFPLSYRPFFPPFHMNVIRMSEGSTVVEADLHRSSVLTSERT